MLHAIGHGRGRLLGIQKFGAVVGVWESGMRSRGSRAAATSGTNFHKDILRPQWEKGTKILMSIKLRRHANIL